MTMITEKPQLQDLNPETPQVTSPQDRLPADFWAQARAELDFGNSLRSGLIEIIYINKPVMNTAIYHVLILPLVGHFKDKSLAFAFASQNEFMTELGSTIVQFLNPVQLTCPIHAGGK
ncbi:hypothetical protein DSO57_1000121 [Entomophthora muscae]|uniref:Uncharacterized protein n=1 Tax=Entomophthora muscae TaxID=34485 RepID=A0ACC2SMG3_9FUNG|nr:hypothetical protein DSO57_1000121 [Entomophthora muscae]